MNRIMKENFFTFLWCSCIYFYNTRISNIKGDTGPLVRTIIQLFAMNHLTYQSIHSKWITSFIPTFLST